MIFHFHKTKVSVNLFIVLKISLASHVTLLVIVIITCIHERKSTCRHALPLYSYLPLIIQDFKALCYDFPQFIAISLSDFNCSTKSLTLLNLTISRILFSQKISIVSP